MAIRGGVGRVPLPLPERVGAARAARRAGPGIGQHAEAALELLEHRQAVEEFRQRVGVAGPGRRLGVELGEEQLVVGDEERVEPAGRARVAIAGVDREQFVFPVAEAELLAERRVGERAVVDRLERRQQHLHACRAGSGTGRGVRNRGRSTVQTGRVPKKSPRSCWAFSSAACESAASVVPDASRSW